MRTGNRIDDKALYTRLDGTYSIDEDMEEVNEHFLLFLYSG